MEITRVNPFAAIAAIWKDKPEVELDGEQEQIIEKLAPREALELKKSLARASKMEGKLSLEKAKNDFKKSTKVENTGKIAQKETVRKQEIEKEIE